MSNGFRDQLALTSSILALVFALTVGVSPAVAQGDHAGHGGGETFGRARFPISCNPAVQPDFDRGIAMLHSFFYPETEKAFRAVAERDPSCAMAYWGIAISQRPNPLTAPFPAELLKQGWEAIVKARTAGSPTALERDWIEALVPFFQDYATVSQRLRSERYEAAMARLHARYPKDTEVTAFYALALLEAVDLSDKSYAKQLRAAALLEPLQRAHPDHPGIPHYLIHAYDYAPIAAKGLPAARRYATLAPSAPHALHMPSHTFSTLGMWPDAIRANIAADAANREYVAKTNPAAAARPAAIAGRYHALDFLTNAYLQLAQDAAARAILDERDSIDGIPTTSSITAHTGFAAIPVRYAFERGAWPEAAALAPIRTNFKQAEAIVWFGRAVGAARSGQPARGREDLAHLSRLREELAAGDEPYWAEQVGIQEAAADAWIALAERDSTRAIARMRAAADREDRSEKHVAMENRLSPMRELLGELLLEAGKPREALREFEASLRLTPNRFRSLAGAADAAARSGNRRVAASHYRKLIDLAGSGGGERAALTNARAFVGQTSR
jgi:tetratricopeptide (TPR) repeat protein